MNELISLAIAGVLWFGAIWFVLKLLAINNNSKRDDAEQIESVSRPAPLKKHERIGAYKPFGGDWK